MPIRAAPAAALAAVALTAAPAVAHGAGLTLREPAAGSFVIARVEFTGNLPERSKRARSSRLARSPYRVSRLAGKVARAIDSKPSLIPAGKRRGAVQALAAEALGLGCGSASTLPVEDVLDDGSRNNTSLPAPPHSTPVSDVEAERRGIAARLEGFAAAMGRRDYDRGCEEYWTTEMKELVLAFEQSVRGGSVLGSCGRALAALSPPDSRAWVVDVESIEVDGATAVARLRDTVEGESCTFTVPLVKRSGAWLFTLVTEPSAGDASCASGEPGGETAPPPGPPARPGEQQPPPEFEGPGPAPQPG